MRDRAFVEDFGWQTRFRTHYEQIALGVIRINVASWDDDVHRNTDMQIATLGNGHRIMCRARRHDYGSKYGGEFTIRLSRPSGAATELGKIRAGFGDYGIYGFEAGPGSSDLAPWVLYNVHRLREYLDHGGRWVYRDNRDGSSAFAAFTVREMPLGFVLNSEGHGPAYPALGPCTVCGRPAWLHSRFRSAACHTCCDALGEKHCPACKASDGLNHYRYGWPKGAYS